MELDASSSTKFKPLTPEERKRRYDNNLCLYCGEGGHRATECPKKKNKGNKKSIHGTITLGPKTPEPQENE